MSHAPQCLGSPPNPKAAPDLNHSFLSPGNYGNEIDGMSKPVIKKKRDGGDGNEEESELLQNSSDEEGTDEGEFMSISTSAPLKPLITDRQVVLASPGCVCQKSLHKSLSSKGRKTPWMKSPILPPPSSAMLLECAVQAVVVVVVVVVSDLPVSQS